MIIESENLNRKKKVTLKDIAEYTGLASNTVSRVLNKKPYYTEEVERRVNEAIIKLGYITNFNAVALRNGSTKTIAIIYDDMVSPFYTYMTNIMANRFDNSGYDTIIFSNYNKCPFLEYELLRKVLARNPDAIVSFIEPEKEVCEVIKDHKLPFLIFGRDGKGSGFDCVCANEVKGGEIATEHLIECGHEKLCYIGTERNVKVCTDRLMGFKNVLLKHGIPYNPNSVFMTKESDLKVIINSIIDENLHGIFCYNDMIAFKVMQELQLRGYNVPQDFSIVGYDNIQQVLGLPKFITTIDVDNSQMADVGAEVILLKLNSDYHMSKNFSKVQIPKLIKGSST